MTKASKRVVSKRRNDTPFNKGPISRKRKPFTKKREETISEKETGFTPEQLRCQQMALKRKAMARFLPDYVPEKVALDEIVSPRDSETEERRSSRPLVTSKVGPALFPKSDPLRAPVSGDRHSEGRHIGVLTAAPQQYKPRVCKGCGKRLPLGASKTKKWCSARCRKQQYKNVCEGCGGPTETKLCVDCSNARITAVRRQKQQERWPRIVELRRAGLLNHQIAIELGCHIGTVTKDLVAMRKAGIEVPDSAYRHQAA